MRDKKDWDTADDRDDAIAILELCWAVLDKYTGGELGDYAHTVERDLRNEWEWHGMDKVTDALSAARGELEVAAQDLINLTFQAGTGTPKIRFISEAYLYERLGKEDARTLLHYLNALAAILEVKNHG